MASVAIAIVLHDFLEGESLVFDCFEEWRLRHTDLGALDNAWQASDARTSITVTLTTTPSRLPHIDLTLKSLLRQSHLPKRIIINVPHASRRETRDYVLPDWLLNLASVEIHRCDDLGPATKLLPSLHRFARDDALLVVDDDRIYHRHMIANLSQAALQHPGAALGFSGWIVPEDLVDRPTTLVSNVLMRAPSPNRATRLRRARRVDVLQGMSGYLVRPSYFDLPALMNDPQAPSAARFVDDVWISGHCRAPRLVIPARRTNFQSKLQRTFYKRNSLGLINRGPGGNENRNNSIVIRYLADRWMCNASDRDIAAP